MNLRNINRLFNKRGKNKAYLNRYSMSLLNDRYLRVFFKLGLLKY